MSTQFYTYGGGEFSGTDQVSGSGEIKKRDIWPRQDMSLREDLIPCSIDGTMYIGKKTVERVLGPDTTVEERFLEKEPRE